MVGKATGVSIAGFSLMTLIADQRGFGVRFVATHHPQRTAGVLKPSGSPPNYAEGCELVRQGRVLSTQISSGHTKPDDISAREWNENPGRV